MMDVMSQPPMPHRLWIGCVLAGLSLLSCIGQAAQLSFPILSDAFMDSRSSNAGKNYGSVSAVKVLINSSDGSVCRGLFQLPSELSLYEPGEITDAKVFFYVWQDNTTNLDIKLYPLARSFIEGTSNGTTPADGATWFTYDGTNSWLNAGGDFDTNYPIVGVKEAIIDPGMNDRFFSWDITALLTNEQARTELLNYGALLQIDEAPPPSTGMPRAPFTSSDDLSYAAAFRPHVQLMVSLRTPEVQHIAIVEGAITMAISNCTPFVTNRIERSFDLLQPDGWTFVTNVVSTDSETNWTEILQPEWTNAYYRISCDE